MGPRTEELESEFAARAGARHAIALTNCTAALHLALAAAGIGAGDEVIVPSLTFVASANAARFCGARVVFADVCGAHDLNLDPRDVEERITPRTRAIVVVHFAGFPAAMDRLAALARERGLVLVEDCAHALFSSLDLRTLGRWGDAGCFSFFSNKNITCGEGGMLITESDELAAQVRLLRSHGMTSVTLDRHRGRAWSYDCTAVGWNYRIDEIRASLAGVQLRRLPELLAARSTVRDWYREALADVGVEIPFAGHELLPRSEVGWHVMPVVLPPGVDRLAIMEALKEDGIQTSVHYPPAHRFSASEQGQPPLPRTEDLAARELTLPFYPRLRRDEVERVSRALHRALDAQLVGRERERQETP
jgi:dTDP-4-amino-4,6-dideoxygalactose transaminase